MYCSVLSVLLISLITAVLLMVTLESTRSWIREYSELRPDAEGIATQLRRIKASAKKAITFGLMLGIWMGILLLIIEHIRLTTHHQS